MGKIIIDITELYNWQGRLTGVPRVINELASRSAKGSNCVFVTWAGVYGYRQISPEAVQSMAASSNQVSKTVTPKRLSYTSRALSLSRKIQQKSKVANKALYLPKQMAYKVRQPIGPKVIPSSGDTLVVMADWHGNDKTFVEQLKKLKASKVRIVQLCYDLLPIVTPQYSGHSTDYLKKYTKAIYPISDEIITISEHTKKDIIKLSKESNFKSPPIKVIRLGDDFSLSEVKKPTSRKFVKQNTKTFLLCVGTIEARKNHSLLYNTYKLAKAKDIELPHLVMVGRQGWRSSDIYEMMTTDPDTKDKFIILEKCSDEELAWLYKNCLFSVYPSAYEGWGLPIAESISYGTPCICSNTSSMPEVAGSIVSYFDPFSTDDCLKAITDMLKPGAIEQAKQKLKQYKPTTWDETFESFQESIGAING